MAAKISKASKVSTKATSERQANGKAKAKAKSAPKAAKAHDANQTPYRAGSSYQGIVDALRKLGTGKIHAFDKIVGAVELPSGFKSKEKRNDETGKSWKDRVIQNVRTLTRKDYGAACRKVLKMEVRTDRSNGAGLFKL